MLIWYIGSSRLVSQRKFKWWLTLLLSAFLFSTLLAWIARSWQKINHGKLGLSNSIVFTLDIFLIFPKLKKSHSVFIGIFPVCEFLLILSSEKQHCILLFFLKHRVLMPWVFILKHIHGIALTELIISIIKWKGGKQLYGFYISVSGSVFLSIS